MSLAQRLVRQALLLNIKRSSPSIKLLRPLLLGCHGRFLCCSLCCRLAPCRKPFSLLGSAMLCQLWPCRRYTVYFQRFRRLQRVLRAQAVLCKLSFCSTLPPSLSSTSFTRLFCASNASSCVASMISGLRKLWSTPKAGRSVAHHHYGLLYPVLDARSLVLQRLGWDQRSKDL